MGSAKQRNDPLPNPRTNKDLFNPKWFGLKKNSSEAFNFIVTAPVIH